MDELLLLLPCPFCGGKATIYELSCGWYVDCKDQDETCSHAPQQQNGIHKREDAIAQWNRSKISCKK